SSNFNLSCGAPGVLARLPPNCWTGETPVAPSRNSSRVQALLSPQNNSRLYAAQQHDREYRRDEGHGNTSREHVGEDAEARHDRRVEVDASDQGRNADADEKAENRANYAEGRGFGGEESVDQTFGSAQSFHDGEVAAAVEDPSDERGEDTERRSENNQRGGGIERGARFVQHVSFAFHDLADGANFSRWQKLRKLTN